jgi:hypothetical protein
MLSRPPNLYVRPVVNSERPMEKIAPAPKVHRFQGVVVV